MIRYIEIPDLSTTPKNMTILVETVFPAIIKAVEKNNIDFVLFPGDLHDCNFYLSKELNQLHGFMQKLLEICPCAGVVGTPGHETEDMYAPLERMGFVLMRPGWTYGYFGNEGNNGTIRKVNFDTGWDGRLDAVLFGIPELIPSRIQQDTGYPTHVDYLREYVAPMRLQFESVPAILAIHGTISDYSQENETDPKKKSVAVFIRTDDLAECGLTRISSGHIHLPFEFNKVCGGYAGSWSEDWGCTGFIPAMNLVETGLTIDATLNGNQIGKYETHITRLPYGTPRREKIYAPLASYDPNVAYWLHLENEVSEAESKAIETMMKHPWSRITYESKRIESKRITRDQAETSNLSELFKLFYPSIEPETLSLVEVLDHKTATPPKPPRKVTVESVEVEGCIGFGGKSFSMNQSQLRDKLNLLAGDNGDGKSFAASFFSPYPDTVGKLPKSGRPSSIWEWFDGSGSIRKQIKLNNENHYHEINIKGQKVSCSLQVEGIEILRKGTFEEMKTVCEELYGSFVDYLLTSFYVQPGQGYKIDGKIAEAGLMNASRTEIQKLVQAIAGIDHEKALETANGNVKRIDVEITEKTGWIKGVESVAADVQVLKDQGEDLSKRYLAKIDEQTIFEQVFEDKKDNLDLLIEQQKANEKEKAREAVDTKAIREAETKRDSLADTIKSLRITISNLSHNQHIVKLDDERLARMTERDQVIFRNNKKRNAYDTAMNNYNKLLGELQLRIKVENNRIDNDYKSKKSSYDSQLAKYKFDIDHAAKPCESCGKIPYVDAQKKLETAKTELAKLIEPIEPTLQPVPNKLSTPAPVLEPIESVIDNEPCTINRMAIESKIKDGLAAQATIEAKQKRLDELTTEITTLCKIGYNLNVTIDDQVKTALEEIASLQSTYSAILVEVGKLETQIHEIKNQILASKQRSDDLKAVSEFVATSTELLARWKYIATQLRSDKIPAMELDTVAETIDQAATEILEPWRDGAYTFRTRTQKQGASKIVDYFDIMVHDNRTGLEKSFTSYSVGERAMMNDAYIKALIQIRNSRSRIEYSPLIADEADSAIDIPTVPIFYAMQETYYRDEKVIIISHTPDAKNYIPNKIIVKELCK
jgi:hypothetical protein